MDAKTRKKWIFLSKGRGEGKKKPFADEFQIFQKQKQKKQKKSRKNKIETFRIFFLGRSLNFLSVFQSFFLVPFDNTLRISMGWVFVVFFFTFLRVERFKKINQLCKKNSKTHVLLSHDF